MDEHNLLMEQSNLHKKFVSSLEEYVISHCDFSKKPMEIDFKYPLPPRIRLYIYNATQPPGGRTLGEYKIQLIVPGQNRGERGSFDTTDGRIVLLAGYQSEIDVFILWDAGLYPEFAYSRNVQVKPETVYAALAGEIGRQQRSIRGQGKEIVLTANSKRLHEAIQLRIELIRKRLLEG